MMETPSSNALIYAIIALNNDIDIQKEYLESPDIPEEEVDETQAVLEDIEQAFMEFMDLYKKRCKADRELPDINEILGQEL
ncbi:MAG: hypothetical protein KAU26_08665 [Methylococcales bacterium]|nr:hypothetical protein [Methylococcales bacterium]